MKPLLQFGQLMLEGSLPDVMGWLDMFRWAEVTINVYQRVGEDEMRANAVCDMMALKDIINFEAL